MMEGSPNPLTREIFRPVDFGDNWKDINWKFGWRIVGETAAIPEPATWVMLIVGFGLVCFAARRRRQAAVTA